MSEQGVWSRGLLGLVMWWAVGAESAPVAAAIREQNLDLHTEMMRIIAVLFYNAIA